jgi:hypothetical protein
MSSKYSVTAVLLCLLVAGSICEHQVDNGENQDDKADLSRLYKYTVM